MATRVGTHGLTHHGALRLLAAVIVALVLVVTLGVTPAAAAEPPTTTEELLEGMVTEEVEPGVYRVLNDGVRDLASVSNHDVVAGLDGSVWVLRPNRFLQLGTSGTYEWPVERAEFMSNFAVSHDGRVWGGWPESKGPVRSFDGEAWTVHLESAQADLVGITPDSRVWAVWQDDKEQERVLGYLGPEGWQVVADTGDMNAHWSVSDTGEPQRSFATPGNFLVDRYVDGSWQRFVDGEGTAAVGSDGTVWVYQVAGRANFAQSNEQGDLDVGRVDEVGWREWSGPQGLSLPIDGLFRVADDGTLWLEAAIGETGGDAWSCDGLAHFDGVSWMRHLRGRCVNAIDYAMDGSVWVLADKSLYVITPEAVADTE